MKIRYYLGFMVIFVLAISAYVYHAVPDSFAVATPDNRKIELPAAMWAAIFLSCCFVLSLLFISWSFISKKLHAFYEKKDFALLVDQVINQSLGKGEQHVKFKQECFKRLSKVLSRFNITPKIDSQISGVDSVDDLFGILRQITLGYEQNIKKYNIPYDNEFFIKNFMNKFKKDYRIGINALKSPMPNLVKKDIFIQLLEFIEVRDLQKFLDFEKIDSLDKDMGLAVIEFLQRKKSKVSDSYLHEIVKKSSFEAKDYLELAKRLKSVYTPDELLRFFERLTLFDEKAEIGHLYVLCDLEMMDLVRQKLAGLSKEEFLNVRAYMDLRAQGKIYPLHLFF